MLLFLLPAAADVLQSAHLLLTSVDVTHPGALDAEDELAVLIAALAHDVKVGTCA